MEEVKSQLFKDRVEILDRVSKHQAIVSLLGYPIAKKCDLFRSEIVLGEQQGKGQTGTAFTVTLPVDGQNKTFVVKRSLARITEEREQKSVIEKYLKDNNISAQDFQKFQDADMWRAYNQASSNDIVVARVPPQKCLITEDKEYDDVANPGSKIRIKKGSYVCEDENFSELVIGMMVANFLTEGKCINFFDQYTMFTCKDSEMKKFVNYIFMEKISGTLRTHDYCLLAKAYQKFPYERRFDAANSVYIQTLFAIAMYQKHLKMSHNDLHDDNVFIQHVTPDMKFGGEYLYDAEYYEYAISTFKSIYIPAVPMIVKIGDFGFSMVYKDPMVLRKTVLTESYSSPFPTTFTPTYDDRYFSAAFLYLFTSNQSSISPFVFKCLKFIFNTDIPPQFMDNPDIYLKQQGYMGIDNFRPNLEIKNSKTAEETLFGPIYQEFGTKPKTGKIVRIGTL